MNNTRRKEIKKAISAINASINLLENILSDEEEAFDNMPEGLQTSENGTVSEDAQNALSDAIAALEEAVECLEEI